VSGIGDTDTILLLTPAFVLASPLETVVIQLKLLTQCMTLTFAKT